MMVLAFGICIFGSEDMTIAQGIVVNVAHQLLSLAAGYEHGRRQFDLSKPKQRGFPVILKDDDDSAAG